MGIGKYSPTVTRSYIKNQNWWREASVDGIVDPEGFDSYGYYGPMGDGPDRAGNTDCDYLNTYCEHSNRYSLYEDTKREWDEKIITFDSNMESQVTDKNARENQPEASGLTTPAWTKFEPAQLPPINDQHVREQAESLGVPEATVYATHEAIRREESIYLNSRYQVNVRVCQPDGGGPSHLTHLSIKRIDKQPIHDWRDLQRIKNELVGPEFEAVEIYPAESRLVDTANQYHLWVFTQPGFKLPFGFNQRMVAEAPGGNAVQRPFEK